VPGSAGTAFGHGEVPYSGALSEAVHSIGLSGCITYGGYRLHCFDNRRVRDHRPGGEGGRPAVSVENVVGLVVSVCLVVYLVLCLIFPEKF
jgi:K+-transporting ATPase KdpF subunit